MSSLDALIAELEIPPLLVEVGPVDRPFPVWEPIAAHSVYVGAGPDTSRPAVRKARSRFQSAHFLDDLIVPVEDRAAVTLHVAKDPTYSSLLAPRPGLESQFIDLGCAVQDERVVRGATLGAVLDRLSLPAPDWLHMNVNGVEVPIFRSLPDPLRGRILALDSCFQLLELWTGQASHIAAYEEFVQQGFWISRLWPSGPIRMRRESRAAVRSLERGFTEQFFIDHHRVAPAWVFLRFFRTPEYLTEHDLARREYVLLWAFGVLDGQLGFAADVVIEYERRFGPDRHSRALWEVTVARLRRLGGFLPAAVRRALRRVLFGM